jgi:subtilisin family serine protease
MFIVCLVATPALAQRGRGEAPTPRAAAPIDLTGYWVSLVTDDWRWRMVTPPKGDILYLPVNDTGTDPSPYNAQSAFALNPIYMRLEDVPGANLFLGEIREARWVRANLGQKVR